MRYVKGHKEQTRNRIVEEACDALLRKGLNGVSVVDLMKLAGLTHGGFYHHFDSRDALVVEAFAFAMDRTVSRWVKLTKGMPVEEKFNVIVESYLSDRHRDNQAGGCVLPALGTDVSRSSAGVRRIFASKLEEMIELVARLFPRKSSSEARQVATGVIATMMGSVALARAAGNKMLADEILEAGRQAARNQVAFRRSSRGRRNVTGRQGAGEER
ncbi:TetR/AcrR family transcriptional repressor of nem operon [Nitrobacteraceae bacterium AZCC 2146]